MSYMEKRRRNRKSKKKGYIPSSILKPDPNATPEEENIRRQKLSDMLPKYDPFKPRRVIDLVSDEKECKEITKDSCFRPDIYLDYGCFKCQLYSNCNCRIKIVLKGKKKY